MELKKSGKPLTESSDQDENNVIISCDFVDRFLSRNFEKLGRCVATNPGYFIIVPILLIAICVTGIQRLKYEDDPQYLFAPLDGRSKTDRKIIDTIFPMNYSDNFHPGRMTKFGRFAHLLIVPNDGGTVLRSGIFEEIVRLDALIKNMTIEYDDLIYRYEDVCAKQYGRCFHNDLLDFGPMMHEIERKELKLKYPIWLNREMFKVFFFPINLGGVTTDPATGMIEKAEAASLYYFLDVSIKHGDERAGLWEAAFLQYIDTLTVHNVTLAKFVSTSLKDELDSNTHIVLPFFSVTVFIMGAFSVITCLMTDWVRSKPWLGLLGCLSAGISVAGAFGICMYAGVEMISINLAAPFLMLGVGMDDAFVLLASWRQTDVRLPVVDRLGKTYADAAVSITITSLTNLVSFIIGTVTPFPSVRIFCIYTAVSVLVCYFFTIAFFGACMAFFGFAERDNLHGLTLQPIISKSEAQKQGKSWLYIMCWTGGRDPADPTNPIDNQEHYMMTFFRDKLAVALCKSYVKFLVICGFIIYLTIAIYGCINVREGLERQKLSPKYSYSQRFYDYEDKYFREYPYRIQIVLNQTLNYADPVVQRKVEKIIARFESSKYIAGSETTESWLRAFTKFAQNESSFLILHSLDLSIQEDFHSALDFFMRLPMTETIRNDVKWNEDGTEITASRFVVQSHNIANALMEKEMLLELRSIADEFKDEIEIAIFNHLFLFFDQFVLVREISIQAVIVATLVMMAISIFFIPSLSCVIWVAFSIISIELGVIGYMTHWGVNLDSISMINLIMCIGFSVDFSAHISYAYMSCNESTPDKRVRAALYSLGLPIFQGSISTILGIIALAFAPSYIFVTFFKTVFLVMLFGAVHGVLLLPVLLSLSDSLFSSSSRSVKSSTSKDAIVPRAVAYDQEISGNSKQFAVYAAPHPGSSDKSMYSLRRDVHQVVRAEPGVCVCDASITMRRMTDPNANFECDPRRDHYLIHNMMQTRNRHQQPKHQPLHSRQSLPPYVTQRKSEGSGEGVFISRISLQEITCNGMAKMYTTASSSSAAASDAIITTPQVRTRIDLHGSDSGQGSKTSTSISSASSSIEENDDTRIELSSQEGDCSSVASDKEDVIAMTHESCSIRM